PNGAVEDFAAGLAGEGLTAEQRRNVEAGLAEARTAQEQTDLDRAGAALKRRNFSAALEASRTVLERNPASETAMRIRVEALSRTNRKRDALVEADRFVTSRTASPAFR